MAACFQCVPFLIGQAGGLSRPDLDSSCIVNDNRANAEAVLPKCGLSQDELDSLCTGEEDVADQPPSPEGFDELLLRTRRTRQFHGDGPAAVFIMDTLGKEEAAKGEIRTIVKKSVSLPAQGLSQAELDGLSVCAHESIGEHCAESSEDSMLRVRRTRHFLGVKAADALRLRVLSKVAAAIGHQKDGIDKAAIAIRRSSDPHSGGLPQADLDALSVGANDELGQSGEDMEDSLLKVRRRRHFMGDEAADALIADAMSKLSGDACLGKDNSDETSTTVSGSSDPPSGGLSQAELDALSVSPNHELSQSCEDMGALLVRVRRTRHFMGKEAADRLVTDVGSKMLGETSHGTDSNDETSTTVKESSNRLVVGLPQAELDALSVSADDSGQASSPEDVGALLLRVRRTRRFVGNEAADALIADIMSPEETMPTTASCDETSTTVSVSSDRPSGGLSQAELDALSICGNDESGQPCEGMGALLLKVRRRRHFMGDEAANDLVADVMSKMKEDTSHRKANDSDETSTTVSGSSDLPPGGLSQAELDALCVSVAEDSEQICMPEGSGELLFQVRRRRHFMGDDAADAFLKTQVAGDAGMPSEGLSQADLDALTICTEEADESQSLEDADTFLLRVRRARRFLGDEAASALVSKLASEENTESRHGLSCDSASTASCDCSDPTGVFSTQSTGLPDERVGVIGCSGPDKEANSIRRLETTSTATGGSSLPIVEFPKQSAGLSQDMLDGICVDEEPEQPVQKGRSKLQGLCIEAVSDVLEGMSPPTSPVFKVATPQRRRGGYFSPTRFPSSPEHSRLPSSPEHSLLPSSAELARLSCSPEHA